MIVLNVQTFPDLEERRPLSEQRRAADIAQAHAEKGLAAAPGSLSRTHCRGVSAVAASDSSHLGIDVELAAPNRPWAEILDQIGATDRKKRVIGPRVGCRVWTLYEAWYKAFSEYPDGKILSSWADQTAAQQRPISIADSIYAWRTVFLSFELCLVWSGEESDVHWI